jgi:Tfp pilus assembly PilM family ATPase/Tfp pilus assembly protein PilN
VVAIDVGVRAVRAVEVDFGGPEPRILKRGISAVPPGYWDNTLAGRDALSQAVKSALSSGGITATQAVAGLPRRFVTLKNARLPHAEPEQIRGMVQFEAQQYIPFPIEDVVLDHQIVSDETDEMTTVMIVAARRALVEEFLAAFDKAGIEVTRLGVSSLALAEHGASATLPLALIDVDSGEMDVAVVSAGRPLFTRAASLGEDGEIDPQRLAAEVARSLSAYQNEYRAFPLSKVLVAAAPPALAEMETALGHFLDIPISRMNGHLMPATDSEALGYATAAGLAMEQNGAGISQVNLIPSSRLEKKAAARRKTNAMAGVAALVLVAALGIFYLMQHLQTQAADRALAQRENTKLAAASVAVDSVKAKHDKLAHDYQVVSAGLNRSIATVDLVKAVSDAVPKDGGVYLTQLTFDRNGTLAIHGNAKTETAATDLVLRLQGSGPFTNVSLNYLGDAQAEVAPGVVAAADKKPKPGEKMSFLVVCKVPVPVVDKPKRGTGASFAQAGGASSTSTGGTQ